MEEKIKILFIFEILGRPAEHIKVSLEEFINQLGNQKGIEILRRQIHEPKPLETEAGKGLFTTFAEVELSLDNLNLAFLIVLNMLPANVEVIEPSELRIKNFDLSSVLSDLTIKLHKYDEIAKTLTMERNILINKLKEAENKLKDLEPKKEIKKSKNIKQKKKS